MFELNLKPEFSSKNKNHRQLIRQDIIQKYNQSLTADEILNIQNLDLIPKSEKIFFSISHHHEIGGYSASSFQHGFDIELKSRISDRIIKRVSTSEEISKSPELKFLWCAKEAAHKALNNSKFRSSTLMLSDLKIENWTSQTKTKISSYRISSNKTLELNRNTGFVFQDSTQIFAIFFA